VHFLEEKDRSWDRERERWPEPREKEWKSRKGNLGEERKERRRGKGERRFKR
jgi:hypothetical protein